MRALRLVNSTLLVTSAIAQEAYLYDVISGRHKQTISFRDSYDSPVLVNYVELGSRHIFVCTVQDVLVYPLDASDSQTLLKFPSQVEGFCEFYKTQAFSVDPGFVVAPKSTLINCSLNRGVRDTPTLHEREFQAGTIVPYYIDTGHSPSISTVHVSPCGSHFVTIDDRGGLCIVRNFEKALRNGVSLLENITIFDMARPILNLAFEDNKRIVVYVEVCTFHIRCSSLC